MSFLEAFPDAKAWHLTVLSQDKVCKTNLTNVSTESLHAKLSQLLRQRDVHVFVRPLLSNLILLDLDDFDASGKHLEEVLSLQPRALVRTSPSNYQAWLTIPWRGCGGDA